MAPPEAGSGSSAMRLRTAGISLAAGGDYIRLPMTAGLEVNDMGRTQLTGRTDLVDLRDYGVSWGRLPACGERQQGEFQRLRLRVSL